MDAQRQTRIHDLLNAHGVGAFIGWRADELVLMTGYYPQWGTSICLYPRRGAPILFNPALEPKDRLPDGIEVREYPWGLSPDPWSELVQAIKTALRERGLEAEPVSFIRSASQSAPCVNSAEGQPIPPNLPELLDAVSPAGWVGISQTFLDLYLVKTARETERIRLAHRVAQVGLKAFYENLIPGRSEAEVASAFETAVQNQMAEHPDVTFARAWAFIQSGPNAIYGGTFSRTTGRRLEPGELVMIECAICVNGYWADITRTGATRGAALSPTHQEMFEVVKTAQAMAVKAVRPGAPGRQVDQVARDYIAQHKYGAYFQHHLGHHVGFRYHDPGFAITSTCEQVLQPGMVITVEPGVYSAELGSGCRIEDNVLVTESGYEILSDFSRELDGS